MKIPSKDGLYSHMPYLHDAGGSVSMLFCLSDKIIDEGNKPKYRPWRIHSYALSSGETRRIPIPSKDDEVEASPVCWYRDGLFTLSFVIGKWDVVGDAHDYVDLRAYKMTGKTLFDLKDVKPVVPFRVKTGFDWYGKAVFSVGDGRIMHDNIDGEGRYETDLGLETITRIVPRHDHTTTMIVTGFKNIREMVTLLYDLEKRIVIGEVVGPNKEPAYKPSLFEDKMAHVVLDGEAEREEYKVELVKDMGRSPSNLDSR